MVGKNTDDLTSMLNRLAGAKSLDKAPPATTAQAVQRNAQVRLRDYTIDSLTAAPNLQERIQQIASGQVGGAGNPNLLQQFLGNPAVRTALMPLVALDTPRRAVISGVREIADALDSDPATRSSFSDFINQTKDPAYGFGTAFPMSGWGGRIVGFAGDVLLDPITYATLGGAVPAKATIRGTNILTREALGGVKSVATRSGREALARLVDKRLIAQEFIEGGIKRTDDEIARIVQNVARRGKSALPADIARDIGIPKPGIYYFGSRVRVPFTGTLGTLVERGLVKARLGIMSTRLGEAIQKAITPTGTPNAALDALSIRDMRVALQQGKIEPEKARNFLRLLKADEDRRIATRFVLEEVDKQLRPLFDDPDLRSFNNTVHELLENPSPERLASAPAAERKLAERLRAEFQAFHENVLNTMKAIDPDFKLGKIEEYFPHMLSEAGIKHIRDVTNPYVESILKFIKMNVGDPANSFKSRNIRAGQEFFGVVLEPKDLTARRLNEIARPKLGFDLFETDMQRVLAKYAQHYAEQMGTARFMQMVQQNPDLMRIIMTTIDVDPEAIKAFDEAIVADLAEFEKAGNNVAKATDRLSKRLQSTVDELEKRAQKNLVAADDSAIMYEDIAGMANEVTAAMDVLKNARAALAQKLYGSSEILDQFQKQFDDMERRIKDLDLDVVSAFGRGEGPVPDGNVSFLDQTVMQNIDRQTLTTMDNRIKALRDHVADLDANAKRLIGEWEKVSAFHNNLSDIQAHLDTAAFGIDTDFSERILDVSETPRSMRKVQDPETGKMVDAVPKVVTSSGRIQDEHIRLWWSKDGGEGSWGVGWRGFKPAPRERAVIAQIQGILDPNNTISQNQLRNMTVANVRQILARGTTSADNIGDLHLALTWLVVRAIKHDPDLAVRIAFGEDLPENLARILQLNDRVSKVDEVVRALRKTDAGAELTPDEVLQSNLAKAETRLNSVTNQIAEVQSQIAATKTLEQRPISNIYDNYLVNFDGRFTEQLTDDEIDGIVLALQRSGETGAEYAATIDSIRTNSDSADKVRQILEFAADEEAAKNPYYLVTAEAEGLADELKELEELRKEFTQELNTARTAIGDADRLRAADTAKDAQSFLDLTREYSEEVLQYYIVNETNLHFARVQKVWEPSGIILGPDIYFRIRSDVAAVQARAMSTFIDEFNVTVGYLQDLQRVVQSLPAGDQGLALRVEMGKLLSDPVKGPMVDKYFPDFKPSLARKATAEFERLLNTDEQYAPLLREVREILATLDLREQTGKPSQRVAGNLTGRQTGRPQQAGKFAETAEDFTSAPTPFPTGATRSIEAQVAEKLSKVSNKNFMTIYNEVMMMLDEGWIPKYKIERGAIPVAAQEPVGPMSDAISSSVMLKARMNELKSRYETIAARVRDQRSAARKAAKESGLPMVGREERKRLRGVAEADGYGLTGALVRALKNTRTSTDVRAFFADLVGNSAKWVDLPSIQVRGQRTLKQFEFVDSYAGRTIEVAQRRRAALYNLADPDLRVDISNGVVPGLGTQGRGMDVWGPRALADAYDERARQLRLSLADDEVYMKAAKDAGIEAEKALTGDLTLDEMKAIQNQLEIIFARPAGRGGTEGVPGFAQLWRFSNADTKLIDALPEPLRTQVYEYRRLRLDAEQMRDSDIAQWAFQEQEFANVVNILGSIDGWRVVDETGRNVLDPFSVYGKKVWNAPRPGMVDVNGAPITSNVDAAWLDTYFENVNPAYVTLSNGQPAIDPRTMRRSKRGLNHEAFAMQEVRFEPIRTATSRGDIYIDELGQVIGLEDALIRYSRNEAVTALRPIPIGGPKVDDPANRLISARIGSGAEYDPNTLWIRMPSEMTEAGQVLAPEVWMRHPSPNILQTQPSQFALTFRGRPLSFSQQEWNSLFIPAPINDVSVIRNLEAKLVELESEIVRLTDVGGSSTRKQNAISKKILQKSEEMKRNPNEAVRLQKEINSLEKEFSTLKKNQTKIDKLNEQIATIKADIDTRINRPIDTKSAAQLQREVNDLRKQLPTMRRQMTKAEQNRVAKINQQIADREAQLSVVRARQTAEAKVRAIMEQVQDPKFREAIMIGNKPTDKVSKLVEYVVKRFQRGSTPDGAPVSVSSDVATARRGVVRSRFNSSDAGQTVSRIQQADEAVRNSVFAAYMRDSREKLSNAIKLMTNAELAKDRATSWSKTASIIDSVKDVTARARKQVGEFREPVLPPAGATPEQLAPLPGQLEDVAWELRNRPPTRGVQPIEGGVEKPLAEIERKFGATMKTTEEAREMLNVLTNYQDAFNALQRAMKAQQDVLAGPEARAAEKAAVAWESAKATYDLMSYSYSFSQQSVAQAKANLERVVSLAHKANALERGGKDGASWANEVLLFADEMYPWLEALGTEKMTREMQTVVAQYVEQVTAYYAQASKLTESQRERMILKGVQDMVNTIKAGDPEGVMAERLASEISTMPVNVKGAVLILRQADEGFVALGERFPNLQVNANIAELFQNVHRARDPEYVRVLSNWLGTYTKFFKTYATLSPGFHIRNAISNGMMLFLGGAKPWNLIEGLEVSRKWQQAAEQGITWDKFVGSLPEAQREAANVARLSTAASGGGVFSDTFKEIRTESKWYNNRLTRASQRFGQWSDDHSRFLFGYDAGKQGMDYSTAAARTRRFFVDYEDVSNLDKAVRQIIPFWMWTSRNLPTQIQNMWLNPKPYQIYNSIKRNLSGGEQENENEIVPNYLKEMGAFKLPFGDNLYATPDFGFNRVTQQLNELADPQRFLSNVNPLIRLPIELAGGRQLYSNREFSQVPVEVEGGMSNAVQPLLQALGLGQTSSTGKKFVNDKAYYALRNLVPLFSTAERLTPSIATYRDRGNVNAWLGFTGAPVRQVTPEMQASELDRRRRLLQQLQAINRAVEGQNNE